MGNNLDHKSISIWVNNFILGVLFPIYQHILRNKPKMDAITYLSLKSKEARFNYLTFVIINRMNNLQWQEYLVN